MDFSGDLNQGNKLQEIRDIILSEYQFVNNSKVL